MIPAFKQAKTFHTSDCMATVIGSLVYSQFELLKIKLKNVNCYFLGAYKLDVCYGLSLNAVLPALAWMLKPTQLPLRIYHGLGAHLHPWLRGNTASEIDLQVQFLQL